MQIFITRLAVSILIFIQTITLMGQSVPKNIIVEHFTNTKCSVCASRNPGFYKALETKPKVIHIAYHPSSPYSSCLFSTQNKIENDARTRYYDLYGGTPTFMINGIEKTSSQVQNNNVYNEFENQLAPFSISLNLTRTQDNFIAAEVIVKAEAFHSFDSLSLYVPLVEDTVFYNAPNGEKRHYDVFRQSFTGTNSKMIKAPKNSGEEFKFTSKISKKSIWALDRLYAVAILQESNTNGKSIIQVDQSNYYNDVILAAIDDKDQSSYSIYPNPTYDILRINNIEKNKFIKIDVYDVLGNILKSQKISMDKNEIDFSVLPKGTYILKIESNTTNLFHKIVKI
jgi:hypothetical protein